MLEEAIKSMEKQRDMYVVQLNNLSDNIRTKTIQRATNQIKRQIQILNFILKILNKQKK